MYRAAQAPAIIPTFRGLANPRATGAFPGGVAAMVKLQTKFAASAFPARSLAPVVIVAVNVVRGARALAGVKVAVTQA